ncbi:hypothetical protein [Desulfobacter hydrogenophilus]|nr:hypothetical protein [Desulfobacter hydrogenophilus]NDY73815.1 hypothetical protein [Desulfobacter hydrogenophilus]QBH13703.1 hypothetical protein EYB58_12695 [Desulfobacter hydrogenophilus]
MSTLYPGSTGIGVTAGTVNIDIPFDILSKTAIFPETSLDRQIAADLRLKNIIDEYLSLKKRNAEVLKGLSIPYLEKNEPPKKRLDPVPEKIKAEKEAKKNMEDVIVFSGGRRAVPIEQPEVVSQLTGILKKDNQERIPARETSRLRLRPEYPEKKAETMGRSSYQTDYGRNTDLPWFFSFTLKLIRFAVDHKLEIFLWAAVLIMSGLIGTIVVKK